MSQHTPMSPTATESDGARGAPAGGLAHEVKELLSDLSLEMDETRQRQNRALDHIAKRLEELEAQPAHSKTQAGVGEQSNADLGGWDQSSADALRSAYDQSFAEIEKPSAPVSNAQSANWLESRLSDITQNLRETLSGVVQPQRPFNDFDERLQQFETGIGAALEEVARRSDLDSIEGIAAEVHSLSKGLGDVQGQLKRLDQIEAGLRDMVGQTVDQSVDRLMREGTRFAQELEGVVQRAGTDALAKMREENEMRAREDVARQDELAKIIESTVREWRGAETDTSSVLEGLRGVDAAQAKRHDELASLIEQSSSERRKGEEQAIAMLDTLQEALVRVFDRLDIIEGKQDALAKRMPVKTAKSSAQKGPAKPAAQASNQPVAAAVPPKAPQRAPQTAQPQRATQPAPQSTAQTTPHGRTQQPATTQLQTPAATQTSAHDASVHPASAVGTHAHAADERVPQSHSPNTNQATESNTQSQPRGTAPTSGRNLVAEARRAQQRASNIQATDAAHATVTELGERAGTTEKTNDKAGIFGTSPKLVALALGAVVLINAMLLVLGGEESGPVITIEPTIEEPVNEVPGQEPMNPAGVEPGDRSGVGQRSRQPASRFADDAQQFEAPNSQGAATSTHPAPSLTALDDAAGSGGVNGSSVAGMSMLELPPANSGPLALRLAAANGNPSAAFAVASRLAFQAGEDAGALQEAAQWYKRAGAKGFALAHYRLGTLYEQGKGVKKDLGKARTWYNRAAEQGNVKSMHNLAVLLASVPDYDRAVLWFTRAAEHGLSDSQFNLAVLLENGLGTGQDRIAAYKWYALAAKAGDKDAAQRRDDLGGRLTKTQLKKAKQLLNSFRPKQGDVVANDPVIAAQQWQQPRAAAQ